MAWWVVMLFPVPVVAVLALVAVIATAFSISAEEDRRRLRLQRLGHRAPDAATGEWRTALELVREPQKPAETGPVERVSTLH